MGRVRNAWLATVLTVFGTIAPVAETEPFHLTQEQELDFRIVELRLRRRGVLAQDVFAYGDGSDLLLPLTDILYALNFPIEVDADTGRASGWFIRETQTFELDTDAGRVAIGGEVFNFDPARLRSDGETLYVPLGLMSSWFGLNSEWNAQNQSINLEPDYLLPVEEQALRNRRTMPGGGRGPRLDVESLAHVNAPYEWIGWPHGTADFSYSIVGPSPQTSDASANISLTGDLLRMTGELFATGSTDGQRTARLALGRTDPGGNIFSGVLGEYGATRFSVGDISTSTHPLLQGGGAGLGIALSRSRLRQGGDFESTRLEGDAFAGWQAELYRDGQLLGFLTVPASGRYIFDDVPLTFGVNRFRIELFGPLGERRTIERPIDVSDAFVRRGEVQYNAEFAMLGRGVFTNVRDAAQLNVDDQSLGSDADDESFIAGRWSDGYVGYADMSWGLTEQISATVGAQFRGGDGLSGSQSAFMTLARRTGVNIVTGDLAVENTGETGLRLNYSTEISGVSMNASAEQYSDEFGQLNENGNSARLIRRSSVRLDGRLDELAAVQGIGWSLSANSNERSDGGLDYGLQGRLSGQVAGMSVSQAVNWRWNEGNPGAERETATSALSVSGTVGQFRIRGGLDLELRPEWDLSRSQIEVSRRYNDWYGRVRAAHDFQSDASTFGFGLSRDFDGVRLGLDVRHSTNDDQTAALFTLGFDFDRHPGGRGMRFGRNARSNRGIASVRVFEDVDLDGVYTPGRDHIVEDAAVITQPRSRLVSDGERIILDDLSVNEEVGVAVNRDRLSDPYLIPANDGVRFSARPAGVVQIDLPVVMSGEVEVALKDDAGAPVQGRIGELASCETGGPDMRERSAFDGYIFFQFVTPGCYELSVPGYETVRLQVSPGDILRPEMTRTRPLVTE